MSTMGRIGDGLMDLAMGLLVTITSLVLGSLSVYKWGFWAVTTSMLISGVTTLILYYIDVFRYLYMQYVEDERLFIGLFIITSTLSPLLFILVFFEKK